MEIKLIEQKFEAEKSFGFTLSQFEINCPLEISKLLKTNVLDIEIKPDFVKESLKIESDQKGYLEGLFYSSKLSKNDFKCIPGNGISYYMEGFSDSEEEWGEDKIAFKKLLDKFTTYAQNTLDGCYLINMEWFNKDSEKVRNREFILYDFYFIIIFLDKNDDSKLYIAEWFGD